MSNSTFTHVSLFDRADPPVQLRALVQFVMEPGQAGQGDVEVFYGRLERYAKKAGITLEQARENVRVSCSNNFDSTLSTFGLK